MVCGTVAKRRSVLVVVRAYSTLWRVSPGLLEEPGTQAQILDQLRESVEHLVIADLDVNVLYTCNRQHSALTRANGTPGDGGGAHRAANRAAASVTPYVETAGVRDLKGPQTPTMARGADILGYKLIKQSALVGQANQAKCSGRGSIPRKQKAVGPQLRCLSQETSNEAENRLRENCLRQSNLSSLSVLQRNAFGSSPRNGFWASGRSAAAVLIRHR